MSLPLNQPTAFNVKKVERKKVLDNGSEVYKLGLELNGDKGWPIEYFKGAKDPRPVPREGTQETLVLEDSQYGLKAKKPGGGSGGGRRPSDPEERSSIEAQVAAKLAVEWGAMQYRNGDGPLLTMEQLTELTKGFATAIREAKG